jgi:hypothetical protein
MTDSSSDDVIVKVSIKFLLSNGVTGSLIGSGGELSFNDRPWKCCQTFEHREIDATPNLAKFCEY